MFQQQKNVCLPQKLKMHSQNRHYIPYPTLVHHRMTWHAASKRSKKSKVCFLFLRHGLCLREARRAIGAAAGKRQKAPAAADGVQSVSGGARDAPTKHQSIKINPLRRNFKEILWARGKQTSCQFMSRGGVKTSRELSLPVCHSSSAELIHLTPPPPRARQRVMTRPNKRANN